MSDSRISRSASESNSRSARPLRLAAAGGAITLSALVLVAAAVPASASPAASTAPAASRPTITLQFTTATVAVGTQPAVTFIGTGLPPGATLYLERGSAAGTGWRDVARSAAPSGTSKIPAAPAGRYEYRMVAIDRGKVIAASPDAALTVTGKRGACTGLCAVGHAVLPWLKPFEQPVADAIAGAVVTWLIGLLFF